MEFIPLSEADIQKQKYPPLEGIYSFVIVGEKALGKNLVETQEFINKQGDPTFKLLLQVETGYGEERIVIDYASPAYPKRMREICFALGLIKKYESGYLSAADFIGTSGKAEFRPKADKQNPEKLYNAVKRYIVSEASKEEQEKMDDEVPF